MSNVTNRESEIVFVDFFVGWILGVGGMALLLLAWTPYEAVGLSVAYMVLGFPIGYALRPVFAFAARRIRRLLGRSGAD